MRRIFPAAAFVAFATVAAGQTPRIGDIDLYGLRKVALEKILEVAGLGSGASLPASKSDIEEQIETVPGVVLARVEAVCCEGSNVVLFVGIEERGAQHPNFRSAPAGDATLPKELVETYRDYLAVVDKAGARGHTGEDLTAGHSVLDDPEARPFEDRFRTFATERFDWLRNELRNGPEAEERAIATAVIGYAPDKQQVAGELQYALQDTDDAVRANAIHGLTAIAVYSSKHPEKDIRVAPTWLVELLDSIVLRDRLEATRALVILTDSPNPAALDLMRERRLTALAEMARWKTLRYALPPFLLLGRLAGLPDTETHQYWEKGDRETVIGKALAGAGTGKRGR
jgi:hypothetical protein